MSSSLLRRKSFDRFVSWFLLQKLCIKRKLKGNFYLSKNVEENMKWKMVRKKLLVQFFLLLLGLEMTCFSSQIEILTL